LFQEWSKPLPQTPKRRKAVRTPKYIQLRHLLVDARRKAGLSQDALASRLKRPQSYVSKFERGERRLDVVEFFEVMDALNVDGFKLLKKLLVGT
jgi:ribosome-binding protein aMBF1 (putative translation factor)